MLATDNINLQKPDDQLDYARLFRVVLSRWYLVAATVLICFLLARLYVWYTPKTYATDAIMKFDEKKSEISELVSVINNADRATAKVQSESFVLKSRSLIECAVKNLDYKISFYIAGRVRTYETYPDKPLDIEILSEDSATLYKGLIKFQAINPAKYMISYKQGNTDIKKTYAYNQAVTIGNTVFIIHFSDVRFKLNSVYQFMISFIDNQLAYLSKQVKTSENSLESYKKNAKVFDVSSSASMMLGKVQEVEAQKSLLTIQLIAINQLKQQISNEKNSVSLNFNMQGTVDPLLNGLLLRYNTLLTEKTNLLRTFIADAQPVKEVNTQLTQIRNAALANIDASVKHINTTTGYLNSQLQMANQQVAALPTAERDMVSLKRDFEINEKVYSFLSEKKLEAQISRSSILAGATIIEQAQANFGPVSPDARSIYEKSIFLGLLLGSGIIILLRMLNPYIYDKETIESLSSVPVIGMIRKFPHKLDQNNAQILALVKPKSLFAESVRSMRTNLSFMATDQPCKVICITSEVAGEGKSFIAVNLASTLSVMDKKVVLIAADLRRSKLHHVFNHNNALGLSNFLANQVPVEQVITKTDYKNIDFITSGPVPPNPSELLHHPNMNLLLEQLKDQYDIIMIDTAPVGLVSDSIPVIHHSDINIFVIRAGKSSFHSAQIPGQLTNKYGLKNTAIVLNDYAEENFHSRIYTSGKKDQTGSYYYADYNGYASSGYYSDDAAPKWWQMSRWIN
ncbi:MAG: polysaccharide biosynthesis tyrosine autokinase [Sphingobacteriaceae bacterium]|nr:MAG: polysaccharide biosynthesis tyrosine autokinase [Sphingobacteriaceae bacterium]